ncbi:hypothetical protein RYX36_022913 [Vicia faba]
MIIAHAPSTLWTCLVSVPPITSKLFSSHRRLLLDFQRKILLRSGLGDEAMHCTPPRPSIFAARSEAESVVFGALRFLRA